ncbi:hypothetical protein DYI22_09450 [Marinobacter lipolyticus]|nr:hypothetical protein [Marinobacter lipolyticus]
MDVYTKEKIDNYHALQQAEVHLISNDIYKSELQERIALEVVSYIYSLYATQIVPYYNRDQYSGGFHQTWGYVSVISVFSHPLVRSKFPKSDDIVNRHISLLNDLLLPSGYYADAFSLDGRIIDHGYMVRSEAWIFSALAASLKTSSTQDTDVLERLEVMYDMMSNEEFSGYESHALSKRKRIYSFLKRNFS